MQNGGVDTDADRVIAGFDSAECRAAREGSLRHHPGGQASAPPGVVNIEAELAKGSADGQGGRCGVAPGNVTFVFL